MNNLPLNGRNFTFLAQLSAGVNSPQADTRGNAASGAFAANGSRPAQNNYLLDGIDNNSDTVDFLNGTNFVCFLRLMQFRSSRYRPRTSARSMDDPAPQFSTLRSSPAPTPSTVPDGNSCGMTN